VNLALRDVRRHLPRFVGTAAGLALLFAVVIAMQGIYAGMVDDAKILTRTMGADLWVVQRDTLGPFAEASRLDPSLVRRAAVVPGVARARGYTYAIVQREHEGRTLRLALVGLSWPDDRGADLPLERGRELSRGRGEMIVDRTLGLDLGDVLPLGDESVEVVGVTRDTLTSAGDAVAFLSIADWHSVVDASPDEALRLERERARARLLGTELGRSQPWLSELAIDPRWRAPVLPEPPLHAVLVDVAPDASPTEVEARLAGWPDVRVLSTPAQEQVLLDSVVGRAKLQIGLFTVILTLTAMVVVMMVLYTLAVEKTHDIAVLKLLGARRPTIAGLVLQQAWLLGLLAYLVAVGIGAMLYPAFPRRVVLTDEIRFLAPVVIFVVTTGASLLGVGHAMRVDAGKVLEG
jgi:putative ABC transport system permease protein